MHCCILRSSVNGKIDNTTDCTKDREEPDQIEKRPRAGSASVQHWCLHMAHVCK